MLGAASLALVVAVVTVFDVRDASSRIRPVDAVLLAYAIVAYAAPMRSNGLAWVPWVAAVAVAIGVNVPELRSEGSIFSR